MSADPALVEEGGALHARWRDGVTGVGGGLADDLAKAADVLERALPTLSRSSNGVDKLAALFGTPLGAVVFAWCSACREHGEARMAALLTKAATHADYAERAAVVAHDRIVEGPLLDALMCAPLLGTGDRFALPENAEAQARLEILFWEAGASATGVPELGKWIWGDELTFDAMIATPAHGSLRGRVLAARCLEVCVSGMPPTTHPQLVGRTLQVLQPLLLHPEPLVWIHAARGLGRLAGTVEHLEGTLLDWIQGESRVLRQRAMTAFASLPAERLKVLGHELGAAMASPQDEDWVLSAAAAGTPYLFYERRELWDSLAERIFAGAGGSVAARALARGLATLWRRGAQQNAIRGPLRRLRQMARRATPDSVEEWRRWLEVIAVTDPVDGAERAPLDLELGLENLVHLASQYDDEEADARAARFAEALGPTFTEARRIALGDGSLRHRAAAMNALEGCGRSLALRLWHPQLATHPRGEPVAEPSMGEVWETVAKAPTDFLEIIRDRPEGEDSSVDAGLEVLAIRLGGYALDACGEEADLGPGRGPTAHATCMWLRKLDGVADNSRELSPLLRDALSAVFWRLVDTTRGTALGAVDDVEWLGPFAAWWALVIDRPAMLQQLATALPMIADGALEKCCELAEKTRTVIADGDAEGQWGAAATEALRDLHADETELAHAISGLAACLGRYAETAGPKPNLEPMCLELVLAAERLQAALSDPVKALHPAVDDNGEDSLSRAATENAPRVAALVARAIRARELSMLDVWFASLGPITSGLIEAAVKGAASRTPPPPPIPKKAAPKEFQGYELVKQIGEGGVGKVWLVRKPGADRLFVLKVPKADALAGASETERAGMLASFVEEAKALAGLYHPNVANIIDRGVSDGMPFLVLELLIGADLQQYSEAKLMSLFELRQIVLDCCAGLEALHGAGLVHRDIKPANLWLRLPLAGDQHFEPDKHRDPAHTQPLSAVVIDFGMVRARKVAPDAAGRFVAGTAGYIAPEQVLDPVELDGRADLYSLAGTIYKVTTGRAFFDDITSPRDRIFAHMKRDPFEDPSLLKDYPAGLVQLMRGATAMDPKDRPSPIEFGRAFASLL